MNLASNQLSDLPASFGDLASLVELDISCNEIQVSKVKDLSSMKLLVLYR
jgi:Leucine-rich repeat (LRR) protein